jgi:hypothetical protein
MLNFCDRHGFSLDVESSEGIAKLPDFHQDYEQRREEGAASKRRIIWSINQSTSEFRGRGKSE